jgi:hypothetical protein
MSEDGRPAEELVTAADVGAIEVVAADAAERLARVCGEWPAERFRELVLDVARVRLHHGVPRAAYEVMRREWEARQRAARRDDVTPSPVSLPPLRGYPAAPDRSASAPT